MMSALGGGAEKRLLECPSLRQKVDSLVMCRAWARRHWRLVEKGKYVSGGIWHAWADATILLTTPFSNCPLKTSM